MHAGLGIKIGLEKEKKLCHIMGVPAHEAVFIFFTYLTGLFKSSVFNFFQNAFFIFNKCGNVLSSFFNTTRKKIEFFQIFNLQCRLEQILIFIFQLKLASSNLPENPQGAPIIKQLIFFVKRIILPKLSAPDSREDNMLSVMYELSY